MNNLAIILMGTPPSGGEQSSPYSGLVMILLMLVVFYFFMIRPQSKRQKEMRKFRESLGKGDKVITAGGIHGKIKNVKETTLDIEIAEGVVITVEKTTITPVGTPQEKR